MKEIIVTILSYLPQYFSDCGAIIVGPKSFVLKRISSENFSKSNESFLFLGISVSIIALIVAQLPYHKDIYTLLVMAFVVNLVVIVAFSFVIRAAWWIVGGRAPYKEYFAVYTYIASAATLMWMCFLLISYGILRILDADSFYALYEASTGQARNEIIQNSSAIVPFGVSLIIGFILLSLWAYISWCAYRQINHLSRMRSFLAFTLTGILSVPVLVLLFVLGSAFD
jgi:hypothetical protein